ncbi:MAG: FHA domain-containing protein [Vallitaleaceae bacterium]|nr:FHA domain-containing protein [Vallitaleaceae bacterium]
MVNFTYERDILNSYLVFNFPVNEIQEYAMKMLQYNKIPHLLEMTEKTEDLNRRLCYEVTDKISLLEYTKNNALEYPLLKKLVESILELSTTFQEYLLSEGCFFLSSQMLFFDLETQKCYFLYLPVVAEPFDFLGQLKVIVADLFKNIHRHDERAISLIHKLRMVLEDENFGVVSIKKLLDLEEKLHLQPVQVHQEATNDTADLEVKKEVIKGPGDAAITFIVLQIILGVVAGFYCTSWVVPEDNVLAIILKIIMLLSALCLCEFALVSKLKKTPTKLDGDESDLSHQSDERNQSYERNQIDQWDQIDQWNQSDQRNQTDTTIENLNEEQLIKNTTRQPSKWGWNNNKTERLSRAKQTGLKRAYWVDGNGFKTPIIKSPFLIGKFKGAVDVYIDNDKVSRIHCKIVQEKDTYNLIHIDGQNCSYLNQQSLETEVYYPLKDGDVIQIGDETFTFQWF